VRQKVTLITGAAGEIGHALIRSLTEDGSGKVLTLDLQPLPPDLKALVTHVEGDILDKTLLERLITQYEIDAIFHLAALLSTRSEFAPVLAHRVNVEGTLGLLQLAADQSRTLGRPVQFIFPSSIAVYGLPDLTTKARDGRVRERDWNKPTTMYGCNKLYCEMLGAYFCHHYRQLAAEPATMIDFRCLRFPGLISAFTVPSGGTSDFGPEMLHAAAAGKPYACFVRADSRIPFMAMPDGVKALLLLAQASREALSHSVYNVGAFSASAGEIRDRVLGDFPEADITFRPDLKRQGIVDSWPADLNDNAAREDWGWQPEYDFERCFSEYLIPNISLRYQ
jgi:nucleoside-diphosphate-sugar epimerase